MTWCHLLLKCLLSRLLLRQPFPEQGLKERTVTPRPLTPCRLSLMRSVWIQAIPRLSPLLPLHLGVVRNISHARRHEVNLMLVSKPFSTQAAWTKNIIDYLINNIYDNISCKQFCYISILLLHDLVYGYLSYICDLFRQAIYTYIYILLIPAQLPEATAFGSLQCIYGKSFNRVWFARGLWGHCLDSMRCC